MPMASIKRIRLIDLKTQYYAAFLETHQPIHVADVPEVAAPDVILRANESIPIPDAGVPSVTADVPSADAVVPIVTAVVPSADAVVTRVEAVVVPVSVSTDAKHTIPTLAISLSMFRCMVDAIRNHGVLTATPIILNLARGQDDAIVLTPIATGLPILWIHPCD